jgi:hypothetical protein
MKILESQAAVLSNWEVYEHLTEQKERYKKTKHRGPQNYEDLVRYVGHAPGCFYSDAQFKIQGYITDDATAPELSPLKS